MYNGWGSIYWDSSVGDTAAWGLYLQQVGVADQPLVDEFTTNYIVGGEDLCLAPSFDNYTSEMGAISGITSPSQGSAVFNGTSDYIQVKDDGKGSAFDTQEFTIGAWFYSDLSNTYNVIWSYDFTSQVSPYYSQHIRVFNDGKIDLSYNIGSNYQFTQTATGLVSANNWHYISVTFESGSQKIYLDGSEVKATTNSGAITYYNTPVIIGKSPNYSGFLEGNLSNVAFWNRALTSDEVNSVMWKQYQDLNTAEVNGLQAWYSLDSTEVFDWYGYARNQGAVVEGRTCVDNALNALAQL